MSGNIKEGAYQRPVKDSAQRQNRATGSIHRRGLVIVESTRYLGMGIIRLVFVLHLLCFCKEFCHGLEFPIILLVMARNVAKLAFLLVILLQIVVLPPPPVTLAL